VSPHGTAFRYDLVYYGLQAGDFDLRDYLRRKDGTAVTGVPPLPVKIQSVLEPGQVLPSAVESRPAPFLGGYRLALVIIGVLWVLGLLGIVFYRRRKRDAIDPGRKFVTLADRLRPLVDKGLAGELTLADQADLERILLTYWRKRLRLEQERPAEAFASMRGHPEAGALLQQLEVWLHRPGTPEPVDIAALLRAYQNADAQGVDGPIVVQHPLERTVGH
jgi:hypothetical protein